MEDLFVSYAGSPLGLIKVVASEQYVLSVGFPDKKADDEHQNEMTRLCEAQLNEYFEGKRRVLDVAVQAKGSEFQVRVWEELMEIPFGSQISYKELAEKLGDSKFTRAVGLANSKNKISIIIPCHRVLGRDGRLTGYAGGLWRKKWLLNHESKVAGNTYQMDLFD